MKDSVIEMVEKDMADWPYLSELPEIWHGFSYKKEMNIEDNMYNLFSYSNESIHRRVVAYYHEETKEYKLRVHIGLTEFCRIDCIAPERNMFEELLRKHLDQILSDMEKFNPETLSLMLDKKEITVWDYKNFLPESYKGFTLFITPDKPVRITNGSYIVFDYENFSLESNVIVYYNMFRDEFFGEAKIRKIPDVNYMFDSPTISALEKKLQAHLLPRIDEVYARAVNS